MATRYGSYGVTLGHTIIRSREPGARPPSFGAEVAALLFLIGLALGFVCGVVW